jgi:hypothetical protein
MTNLNSLSYSFSGPDERQVAAAKDLADDLLTVVREEHAKAIATMTMNMGGGYGMGYGGQQGYAGYQQQQQQGYAGYPVSSDSRFEAFPMN